MYFKTCWIRRELLGMEDEEDAGEKGTDNEHVI